MGQVRLFSDPHFRHKGVAKWRGFDDVKEHDELIINNWNKTVTKRDLTFLLGDVSMHDSKAYELLDKLNGRIVVIGGNHDDRKHSKKLMEHVEAICGVIKYKGNLLSHVPIHESQLERFRRNIHGHVHLETITKRKPGLFFWKKIPDKRYINVCAEVIDYTPKTLDELINRQWKKL